MYFKRWTGILAICCAAAALIPTVVLAQSGVDTMTLVPMPPDSSYVRRDGGNIVIGWYPPANELISVIGSRDFTNWYGSYGPAGGVEITFSGNYTGDIDRTLIIRKLGVDTRVVGTDSSVPFEIETVDFFNRTFGKLIDLGTDHYTPGDPVEMTFPQLGLEPGETADSLRLGFNMHFSAGAIDTSIYGTHDPATFMLDLQTMEGYHVWRGLSPYPGEMQAIAEISKEDYFKVSNIDAFEDVPVKWRWLWEYFNDNVTRAWPRRDASGRTYYEWVDDDVFAGFTYYYTVTTYDRGYYKGFDLYNKVDSYICDEDLENPETPGEPVPCEDTGMRITMTVDAGRVMRDIYAVPNPYRSGTSAQSTPYYHNFPDRSIKFFNVPAEAVIRIFTVAGDIVWETRHVDGDGDDGIVSWNTRNRNGQDVSSGVYVFRVERTDGEDVYGRIVVIR